MAAIANLYHAPSLLVHLLSADPRLRLLNAMAWLDPYGLLSPDDREDDDLLITLHVCRESFPQIYAEAVQLHWQGASTHQIARQVLDELNRLLVVPLTHLEEFGYGPPIDFCGLLFPSQDTPDASEWPDARVLPVFALFGLIGDESQTDQAEDLATLTARILVNSLLKRTEPMYADLSNLLQWLFSLSGNTAIDYTLDAFWDNGFDPAQWTPEDIALINEINQEAHDLRDSAIRALDQLDADTSLLKALKRNIRTVKKAVLSHLAKKGKVKPHARLYVEDGNESVFIDYARWP